MDYLRFLLSSLLVQAALHGALAVEYFVTNQAETTPGGIRFNNELCADYTKERMDAATNFIWNIFQQSNKADRRSVDRVTLFVDDMGGIAHTKGNEIHVEANYIEGIKGNIKQDFSGVLYHEMTHVWQWLDLSTGRSRNVTEGMADFVRLKANYVPSGWVSPGQGENWDDSYWVTARFLDYCNTLKVEFVAELNKKMKNGYKDNYFMELLGKTADQLWSDYKAKYRN